MIGRNGLLALGALVVTGAFVHGCGGGSSSGGGFASTAAGVTSGGLSVVATTPVDGEGDVDPAAALSVTFDLDVAVASVTSASFSVLGDTGPVPVGVALVTSRVVAVTPAAPLAARTSYLLRVTQGVTGAGGEALGAEALVRFTTRPPRVPVTGGPAASGNASPWQGGAAEVDITPVAGVPLAGYGGGDRRRTFPDLNPFDFHTLLQPSRGVKDPVYARALVLANATERVCLLALDAIATDADVLADAHRKAAAQGFTVPLEKILAGASHTHSGPGAITKRTFWQLAAADLYVDRVYQAYTDGMARAMVEAERALGPVHLGVGREALTTVTRNRRAGDSPALNPDSIDDELLVLRVDRPDGTPVATVWNFAIHGTHFGTSNMDFSADIMGSANAKLKLEPAGVPLFLNGCEGDIAPRGEYHATGQTLCDAVMRARGAATTTAAGALASAHEWVDFGVPTLDLSVQRLGASNSVNQPGIFQALNSIGVGIGASLALPRGWIEQSFRIQAIRVGDAVFTSFPGEPIHTMGLAVKLDGKAQGFAHVFAVGLANGHGAYWTTESEWHHGGYEAIASFFGPKSGERLIDAIKRQVARVKP